MAAERPNVAGAPGTPTVTRPAARTVSGSERGLTRDGVSLGQGQRAPVAGRKVERGAARRRAGPRPAPHGSRPRRRRPAAPARAARDGAAATLTEAARAE